MKILPIEKIREADAFTIENEPIADIDLMERAARELFEWIIAKTDPQKVFRIFCGMGNNGGDGFALARMLSEAGFKVEVFLVKYSEKMSPGCKQNFDRILQNDEIILSEINPEGVLPDFTGNEIIIDAVFGSGLTKPINGFVAQVVDHINNSGCLIISVDVPSGFFCDQTNSNHTGSIIRADYTLTFQFPKFGFMFSENDQFVGEWEVLPIGLHPDFINDVTVKNHFLISPDIKPIIKRKSKFSHKGTYGHGLLIAGSYGKMGAAVLAASSAIKAGAGLITAHIPKKGYAILQTAAPEVMVSIDSDKKVFSDLPYLANYDAIAVGPGIGLHEKSFLALKLLIQDAGKPIIVDADAINMLSENSTWISFIPKYSIFTPHPKEFERLTGKSNNDYEQNEKQREFSIKYQSYVILKGAYTAITCPDGTCYFNSTGNPGMATGGSGDVLTGILLGLKAQGYSSLETCLLGVFLHGLAGDIAANKTGFEALTAGDIIQYIGKAFKKIHN